MILRKVTKHVTDQNWFAVFIDFLIVVVGVFIGLQVANWNSQLTDQALEKEYLERIYFDAVRSINSSEKNQKWSEQRLETQTIVLKSLRNGELLDIDKAQFGMGLAFFGYVSQPNRNWQAVKELQSTGRMTLIKDVRLRELIGQTELKFMNRDSHEAGIRKMRREHFVRISSKWEFIGFTYGVAEIKYDFQTLLNDPEILNILSQMHMLTNLLIRNTLLDVEAYTNLKEALVATLGYVPEKPQSSLTSTTLEQGID